MGVCRWVFEALGLFLFEFATLPLTSFVKREELRCQQFLGRDKRDKRDKRVIFIRCFRARGAKTIPCWAAHTHVALSLPGRRKTEEGQGDREKRAKSAGKGTVSPQTHSLFPFSTNPPPFFRSLLRRLHSPTYMGVPPRSANSQVPEVNLYGDVEASVWPVLWPYHDCSPFSEFRSVRTQVRLLTLEHCESIESYDYEEL